jgi:surface carbohydrate biosynthesis protein
MNLIRRLIRLLATSRKYRYSFRIPHQSNLVIYPDGKSAEVLLNYVNREETQVLAPFGDTLNVPVLLRMLLAGKSSRFFYLLNYLKFIKPSLVITTADNDLNFYRIKSFFPHITTIAIQNGVRGNLSTHPNQGFFELLKLHSLNHHLSADFVCTFGSAVQDEYRKYISANFIACGSLRNNFFVDTTIEERPNRLAYVSGISEYPSDPDRVFLYFQDIGITFKEFYEAEGIICALLADYCATHNLEFVICGKRNSTNMEETTFYRNVLKHSIPYISPRDEIFDSYTFLSTARYIVTLDSTIAYEFLSRKKRTAFFSARFNRLEPKSLPELTGFQFGYPQLIPKSGQFWSSVLSMDEIERVVNNLRDLSESDWEQVVEPYKTSLMIYDQGNTILQHLIDSQTKIALNVGRS